MSDDWDKDESGVITAFPLVSYRFGIAYQSSVLVQLGYAPGPQELGKSEAHLQIVATPEQALRLARELKRAAEHILAQKPKDRPG